MRQQLEEGTMGVQGAFGELALLIFFPYHRLLLEYVW